MAKRLKISIFMSVFNVHINRAPISGKVFDLFYKRGKFLDVRDSRATFENEQSGMLIETAGGVKLMVVQVAGLIARRIVCYAQKGDDAGPGRALRPDPLRLQAGCLSAAKHRSASLGRRQNRGG